VAEVGQSFLLVYTWICAIFSTFFLSQNPRLKTSVFQVELFQLPGGSPPSGILLITRYSVNIQNALWIFVRTAIEDNTNVESKSIQFIECDQFL
jgi:hypothetical protein